ncbi:hypothetical protein BDZ97DRAFT_1902397 [Flammula alnicola]|nr:hypothetical protein BDZ97DRAFT_1902397 [Flammula alnicola]
MLIHLPTPRNRNTSHPCLILTTYLFRITRTIPCTTNSRCRSLCTATVPSIPIDPALALYPPYYSTYQQHQPPHIPNTCPCPKLFIAFFPGSDTIGTPPTEHMYPSSSSNINGKRPSNPQGRRIDIQSPVADKEEVKAKPTRGSRACTVCRRLKMKCVGAEQGPPCKRCLSGNHECIFEESNRGRGRRSLKHEILTRSLRKMERTLDTYASGMISRSPSPSAQVTGTQALLARSESPHPRLTTNTSLANRRAQAINTSVGVASDNYFKPGPMTILPLRRLYIERQVQPEMLSFVSTEEVVALFNIYFDHIHANRNFHTPSLVCSRSPFLLTTSVDRARQKLAFSVPAKGYKSVEIVQAYLLLSLWGCGAVERYEQDKTWLLLGMAIRRSSQDTQEGKARDIEVHNRERTWIMCFCLDRSFSAQMGKPSSIKEDYIIRHTTEWYTSPVANPSDVSLAAYAELQRILSRSLEFLYSGTDSPSGLQLNCDYLLVIKTFETQMLAWKHQWIDIRTWDAETAQTAEYKKMISNFYFNYAMLILNSFGLQNALERAPMDIGHFFARVHSSAHACANLVRDELGPSGYMKYSPDSHFVQTSYAVLSLLKLVRPEFQAFLDNEQKTLNLVRDVADVLDNIAANPLHTPALYSGFLRALISAKLEPGSHVTSVNGEDKPSDGDQGNDPQGGTNTPSSYGQQQPSYGHEPSFLLNEFQFDSEMGPVADMSTFPPTMAPNPSEDSLGALTMENILSSSFWDSMLVPGYNSMDGLSGGFVFGAGGSGLITPRFGISPMHSGANTPGRLHGGGLALTQTSINAAFDNQRKESGIKIDA